MSLLCPLDDEHLPMEAASLKSKQVEVALQQLRDVGAAADVHQSSLESLARLAWSDDEVGLGWVCGQGNSRAYGPVRSEQLPPPMDGPSHAAAGRRPNEHKKCSAQHAARERLEMACHAEPATPANCPPYPPNKVREAVASGGGVRGIVDVLLTHSDDDGIVCNACLALMSLVRGESEVCQVGGRGCGMVGLREGGRVWVG
jgi:hypothetical protein